MSPKKTNIQERKDTLLDIVVDEYIKTITPVSSGFIAQEYHLELSPATIRNTLAELEDEGYLTHPHTSAGRIPTQKGYRYYVDNLMHQLQLLEQEKNRIISEYNRGVDELENLLEKTSSLVSEITHYTSIISVDGWNKMICKGTSYIVGYPDTQDIQKIRSILQALEEKEHLLDVINRDIEKQIEIYIGKEMKWEAVEGCSLAVARYRKKDGTSGRIAVLGPTRMDYERVVSTLNYICKLVNESPN